MPLTNWATLAFCRLSGCHVSAIPLISCSASPHVADVRTRFNLLLFDPSHTGGRPDVRGEPGTSCEVLGVFQHPNAIGSNDGTSGFPSEPATCGIVLSRKCRIDFRRLP